MIHVWTASPCGVSCAWWLGVRERGFRLYRCSDYPKGVFGHPLFSSILDLLDLVCPYSICHVEAAIEHYNKEKILVLILFLLFFTFSFVFPHSYMYVNKNVWTFYVDHTGSLPVYLNDHKTNNFLVTSSCDHSIHMWWKGSCQRCFRGHSGPVSTLSDKLLGDGPGKVLASGGEDDTHGQRALKSTLYGHVKPIKLIFVAVTFFFDNTDQNFFFFFTYPSSRHKTSLLTTISTDSMVRVCDTTIASSASRSSFCVGKTSIPGVPVNMKCHESLLYVAAGSSVVAIDLRTMQKVNIAVVHQSKLYLFEALLSKSLICIGGIGSAMLWDIRRNQEPHKPEPIAEMDGNDMLVSYLHMDSYKIVTAGLEDSYVNVWDVDTGTQTNALSGSSLPGTSSNCSSVAVDGCRIVTTHYKL
ncbi:hypothetical protein UlMin_027613 [Ulmus minor]